MNGFNFPKKERVCAKSDIELLFAKARSIRKGSVTLRYICRPRNESPDAMVLIVVPKKRIRLAVNRNLLKRRLREIYRLNKLDWKEQGLPEDQTVLLAIQYSSSKIESYAELKKNYLNALVKIDIHLLITQLNKN